MTEEKKKPTFKDQLKSRVEQVEEQGKSYLAFKRIIKTSKRKEERPLILMVENASTTNDFCQRLIAKGFEFIDAKINESVDKDKNPELDERVNGLQLFVKALKSGGKSSVDEINALKAKLAKAEAVNKELTKPAKPAGK